MNESDKEEPMEEEVSNENGGHAWVEDEITYLLSGDADFAGGTILRQIFFNRSKHWIRTGCQDQ